jgi:iron complex transport system substrate-binding protein
MSLTPPAATEAPRTVPLAVLVVAVLVGAGLATVGTAAYLETRPTASGGPGTVSITDDLGRTVSVPVDPARVAVLSPSIMDSMFRLGLRSHVVGVDCYPPPPAGGGLSSDYNATQIAEWNLTDSMCIQVEPALNVESLLNATPQLVLASTIISTSAIEEISDTYHVPVLLLQPSSIGGILVDVELLGRVFDVPNAADALVASMQAELGVAGALQANLTEAGTPFPTVLVTYYADSSGYWTFGPGTFGDSLISLVSASSIGANSTLPYPELSASDVLVANPSVVLYAVGFGLGLSSYSSAPFWSDLGAVSDGHAWPVSSNLLTEPDPTMVLEGIPALLALLHPG